VDSGSALKVKKCIVLKCGCSRLRAGGFFRSLDARFGGQTDKDIVFFYKKYAFFQLENFINLVFQFPIRPDPY